MAKGMLPVFLIFVWFVSSGGILNAAFAEKKWCVAKPSSDPIALQNNINYVCTQLDCGVLQQDGPCFLPDNLINHASVAMNIYYQANGRNSWNCHFSESGLIASSDPSYGSCIYA